MSVGPAGEGVPAVTIEGPDDGPTIVTPELRLRFRWAVDRWAHALDLRPGPWQLAVESIEADDVVTYQEVQLQRNGDDVLALALGRAGPHHVSAAFRVRHQAYQQPHFAKDHILQLRSVSRIEVDLADRCRSDAPVLEARYRILTPPIDLHLGDSRDGEAPEGYHRDWRSCLVWEAAVAENYHLSLEGSSDGAGSQVAIVNSEPAGSWPARVAGHCLVRVAARAAMPGGTTRFSYAWEHHRVRVIDLRRDAESP